MFDEDFEYSFNLSFDHSDFDLLSAFLLFPEILRSEQCTVISQCVWPVSSTIGLLAVLFVI